MLEQHHLDVLFLEEVGLCAELLSTLKAAVEKVGYRMLADAADLHQSAGGWHQRGVICITAWPMEVEVNPLKELGPGRLLFTKLHRALRRPLKVCGLYLDASNPGAARELAEEAFLHLRCTGEDSFFIGDWNLVRDQEPICAVLAAGLLYAADDGFEPVERTAKKRVIDYGLYTPTGRGSGGLDTPVARYQLPGVADHDLIAYDLRLGQLEPTYRRRPFAKLREEPVDEDAFEDAAQHLPAEGSVPAAEALAALLNLAEDLLQPDGKPVPAGAPRRTAPPRPTQRPRAPTRPENLQSFKERSLRRCARKLQHLLDAPREDPPLMWKIRSLQKSLS